MPEHSNTHVWEAQARTALADSTWLSQVEAAEYLRVTDRTIRNYIASGVLPGHRIKGSRMVRIRRADCDALMRPIPSAASNG